METNEDYSKFKISGESLEWILLVCVGRRGETSNLGESGFPGGRPNIAATNECVNSTQ
jgi:hypothetical protein